MILRLVDILNFNLNFNLWCTKGISVHNTGVSYFETLHLLYAFILIWIQNSQLLSNEERLLRRMHAWYQYSLFCDSNGESNRSLDQILLWQRTNAWNVSIYYIHLFKWPTYVLIIDSVGNSDFVSSTDHEWPDLW